MAAAQSQTKAQSSRGVRVGTRRMGLRRKRLLLPRGVHVAESRARQLEQGSLLTAEAVKAC